LKYFWLTWSAQVCRKNTQRLSLLLLRYVSKNTQRLRLLLLRYVEKIHSDCISTTADESNNSGSGLHTIFGVKIVYSLDFPKIKIRFTTFQKYTPAVIVYGVWQKPFKTAFRAEVGSWAVVPVFGR
jgi:hypothetical protein